MRILALALIVAGLVLIVTAYRNRVDRFTAALKTAVGPKVAS